MRTGLKPFTVRPEHDQTPIARYKMTSDRLAAKGARTNVTHHAATAVYCFVLMGCLLLSACAAGHAPVQNRELVAESADGSRISYGVSGHGNTTLVFVHGWLGDHSLWQSQIDYFSRRYKVVWLDLAGHGNSTTHRQEFTIPAFARDVAAVFHKAGGQKAVLIGHSMGGPVAVEAAGLLGEKVVGIIGVDAFYTPLASVPKEMKMKFHKWLKKDYPAALAETVTSMFVENADPGLVDSTYQKMLAGDRQVGVSSLYECIKWNSETEPLALKAVSDRLYNINGAPAGSKTAPHKSVTLIPGTGHFVPQVNPNEFNAAMENILQNL